SVMFKNSWIFPALEAVHLIGMAAFVGTVVLRDLRLLQTRSAAEPVGLVVVLSTGVILFLADVPRYLHNPAFIFKILVLAAALVLYFAFPKQRTASLILWTGVVLAGRAIADFDI